MIKSIPRTTKTSKEFYTPDWAKKVVWYQIFPERFRNGDASNDPRLKDIAGSWPHDDQTEIITHPWNSDWYKLQPYEMRNSKDIWYNLLRRRYGGDLQGIIDKLDYLKELGIGALYLNPIFESPSLHKYDGSTFHHIDPTFGPDPVNDRSIIENEIPHDPSTWTWTSADKLFLKLISEVHNRDMKIIIDGVFNHMGINSWAFKDVVKNQGESLYNDWFKIKSWKNESSGTSFAYEGWNGVRELPEINQDKNGIVEGPKKYIFDITKRWMDPYNDGSIDAGIDGWRLDVAYEIKHEFWKDWRKHVKSINPEAYLTAEIIDGIDVIQPYLEGDEFDAVMNYNFSFACSEFFTNDKTKIDLDKFDSLLRDLRDAFPNNVNYVMQNLFDSHDSDRLLSHIANKDIGNYREWLKYFESSKGINPRYQTRKPGVECVRIQKLIAIFQFAYVGAPMIYYGDEAGMWGATDPDCRKPMLWNDIDYEDEKYAPDQSAYENPRKVEFNKDLFAHYKKLAEIRNQNLALQIGDFKTVSIDNENSVYVFERCYEEEKIIVALNNNDTPHHLVIRTENSGQYYDILNGLEIITNDGELTVNIPGKWGSIIKWLNV